MKVFNFQNVSQRISIDFGFLIKGVEENKPKRFVSLPSEHDPSFKKIHQGKRSYYNSSLVILEESSNEHSSYLSKEIENN